MGARFALRSVLAKLSIRGAKSGFSFARSIQVRDQILIARAVWILQPDADPAPAKSRAEYGVGEA